MKSIRVYLIVALLSTITLINFLAATRGYQKSTEHALELLDIQLADTASLIQALPPGQGALKLDETERLAFQVWATSVKLESRSNNAGDEPITAFEPGYRDENFGGFRWRVVSQYSASRDRWVFVAERLDIRMALVDDIIIQSVLPILLSLPLVAALVWLVVGNGLSRLTKLANELSHKRVDDLTMLETDNAPVELIAVVNAVNGLLTRLDASLERERHFSADAAHELRTPLSALKVHVHNLFQAHPQLTAEAGVLTDDLDRLGHLIEQIIALYRTAPEHYQSRMKTVSLQALAQQAISDMYEQIDQRNQLISLDSNARGIVGDEPSLLILIKNLISNASKYSEPGTEISIEIDEVAGGVRFSVIDNGPGIPILELNRVQDRFYRVGGDQHSSAVKGCGLGLSIVRHVADLHQAVLQLQNNDNGKGLIASVIFPFELEVRNAAQSKHT